MNHITVPISIPLKTLYYVTRLKPSVYKVPQNVGFLWGTLSYWGFFIRKRLFFSLWSGIVVDNLSQ